MQSDRGHQNGGHGDHRHRTPIGQAQSHHGSLVFAEEVFDPSEGDRIDVPGVSRNGGHLFNGARFRTVEAVVHVRGQSQGDEATVLKICGGSGAAEEIFDRVGESLRLESLHPTHRTPGSDDAITGTHQDFGIRIHRSHSGFQFAGEAFLKAVKSLVLGFAEVEVGEELPHCDRSPREQRISNTAEAAHGVGQQGPWQTIGEQKVQILLQQQAVAEGAQSGGSAATVAS